QQVLDVTGFETDAAQLDAADLGFGTADFVRGVSSGDPFGFPQPAELGTEQHAPYCRAAPRLWLSHIHRCFLPTQWLVKNPFPRDSLPYHVVLMVTRYRLRVRVFRGSMPQSPEKSPTDRKAAVSPAHSPGSPEKRPDELAARHGRDHAPAAAETGDELEPSPSFCHKVRFSALRY